MVSNLRYLGDRRVGGRIVAFTGPDLRDAYGNYWTPETDFALQRYERRPVYYQHRGGMVEAGYIEKDGLSVRGDGLYAEADLLENEAGERCLALVKAGRGHWSTGVMPGSFRERSDGFMEFWPIVEASVTDHPATKAGLTRVAVVRGALGWDAEQVDDENEYLRRGPVVAENETQSVNGAGAGVAGAGEAGRDQIAAVVRAVMEDLLPSRVLPAAVLPDPLRAGGQAAGSNGGQAAQASVAVGHRYDSMTLAGLAMRGALLLKGGKLDRRDETELIRALQAKIAKQRVRDEALTDEQRMAGAVRMIDDQVIADWGRHIRADEAMTSVYDGYGDQLVPTLLSSVLWYHFMLEARVLNALPRVMMPSNPWDYPVITGGPTIRRVLEIEDQANFSVHASPIPSSKIGTGKKTFSAGKIGALVLGSAELMEDAGVNVMDVWATQLIRQMAAAVDEVLISGDEAATTGNISHYGVDPTGTAYDKILVLDGLRKMAVGNSDTAAQTAVTQDSPGALRELMGARGRFGLYPRDLIIVADPAVYYDLLALDAFESLADMGPQATLLTGQVGQVKGVPVIVSEQLEATNASGQVPSAHNGTLGSYLVVNRRNVMVGYRREISTEVFRVPGVDGFSADVTVRLDLQEMEAGNVAYGYNVGGV